MPNPPDNAAPKATAQTASARLPLTDAEQGLQETRDRLELALDLAQMGTWDLDIIRNRLQASARAALLHGMPALPVDQSGGQFFGSVCPPKNAVACVQSTLRHSKTGRTACKSPTGFN